MKVWVDEDVCVSDQTCVEICREVFEMRGDVVVAKIEVVPEEYGQSCQEAADSCPVEAILIEE